jgi:amino acid transporter
MASEKVAPAPAAEITSKSVKGEALDSDNKHVAQDIKPSDAEGNHSKSAPGQLKRKLKSRHLQMIAIGSFRHPYANRAITLANKYCCAF